MARTAKDSYAAMEAVRRPYLERARLSALLTLPALIPPEGHSPGSAIVDASQSIGADAVNSLANKLLQAILNDPFFRLSPSSSLMEELRELDEPRKSEFEREISIALADVESIAMRDIDSKTDRVAAFEALKHLIVGGNALLMDDPQNGLKLFRLDKYTVRRDAFGVPLRIIVREVFEQEALPEEVRALVPSASAVPQDEAREGTLDELPAASVELFTVVDRRDDRYYVWQETADGTVIPGSASDMPMSRMNWFALRMVRVEGEDYGRGRVEEYTGDLGMVEILSRAIGEGAVAAAKVVFLVRPNSTTKVKTLGDAKNGAVASGDPDDVGAVQMDKYNDFRVAAETLATTENRLRLAFLMNQAARRDGERVTAEEIRLIANELEQGLGGLYGLLTQEFQLPYIRNRLAVLQNQGVTPRLPEGAVNPVIITGLEALDRSRDAERIIRYLGTAGQVIGQEIVTQRLNITAFLERLGVAEGVDTSDLLKTEEQVAQEAQQAQQAEALMSVGSNLVDQGGQVLQQQLQQQSPAPTA